MALRGKWFGGQLHFYDGADSAIGGHHINFGRTDSGALLHGAGTSTTRVTTSTADKKFLSYYVENSATSGDNRGMYLRLYLSGAGGGGEAARIFTTINNVAAGTAHGAHLSLSFGTTGSVTGLGVAGRNTLHVPNGNLGATTAAVQAEIWADGAISNNTGTMSHFRTVLGGNATGIGNLKDVFFVDFAGMSVGSGEYIDTDITSLTPYAGVKVNIPGVGARYIALVSA